MSYKVFDRDKLWTKGLISIVSDGATWGTSFGVYVFDKEAKVLTLKAVVDESLRKSIHDPIVAVFESIGWKVKTEEGGF